MKDILQTPDAPEAPRNERCVWLRAWFRKNFRRAVASPASPRNPEGTVATTETVRRQSPRQKARIALGHLQKAFGGELPPSGTSVEELSRIAEPGTRAMLTTFSKAQSLDMDGLVSMLMTLAGFGSGITVLLAQIQGAFPDGVPDDMTAAEFMRRLPDGDAIGAILEHHEFVFAHEIIRHVRDLDRRKRE